MGSKTLLSEAVRQTVIRAPQQTRVTVTSQPLLYRCQLRVTVTSQSLFYRCRHSGPTVDIPKLSLTKYVFKDADSYGQRVALVDGVTGATTTFNQLREEVDHVTRSLVALDVGQGHRVTLFASNSPDFAHVLLGVTECGAALSLANSQLTADELTMQLQASGTSVLVTSPDCADRALTAARLTNTVKEVIVLGEYPGCLPFHRLKSARHHPPPGTGSPEPDDVALLPFSSGTTGLPKGVMLTHRNLVAELAALRHPWFLPLPSDDDTSVSVLPMVHIAGLMIGLVNPLAQGARVVTLPRFEPVSFLQAVQHHRGTFSLLAPPVMTMLAQDPRAVQYDLTSLHTPCSGAAALGADLTQRVVDRLGLTGVRQGYGMTETSPATHTAPLTGWKYGSVGVPLPNTQSKVIDIDFGTEVGPNREGEVVVKGPQVMLGYLNVPTATQQAFTPDGWLRTGDIGYYDDEGHYFIVDRLKDIIKYKGYQISPVYLESVLLGHPNVGEVAVVGVPAAGEVGELATAWVVLKEQASSQQLLQYVHARVAPYRQLRGGVEIVPSIPKSPSGKILRRHIRQEIVERSRRKDTS
ncbi:probable 4-coumarate--CoA ligase 1 [Littorina saxatilis]|uniref:probable 4-coumarate--CoA ligase 1 n=1 Tax=Littorina saxatilis TaxID=31220 RepID=UPI0038B45B82